MTAATEHQYTVRRATQTYFAGLALLLAAAIAYLGWQTYQRMLFPWDLFIWSESPFLTNMVKLVNGLSIYTDPEQANSFVYSFGLEWLSYALLGPLNLALDIRAARLVCILLGVGACLTGALVMRRVLTESPAGQYRGITFISFSVLTLTLFQNVTSYAVHPDNLHIFHATVTLALGLTALKRQSLQVAAAAMLWAALGVLTKQTGALACAGLAGAFLWSGSWPWNAYLRLLATGSIATLVCLSLLWAPDYGRFWTLDVLLLHQFDSNRLNALATDILVPWRLILSVLTPAAVAYLYRHSAATRQYAVMWLSTFAVCCVPNLLAYFKALGLSNNLGIIDLWMMLAVWPALLILAIAAGTKRRTHNMLALLGTAALGGLLISPQSYPSAADYAFGNNLDAMLRADREAGCVSLVDNNTAAWLRAGFNSVPLDKVNTFNNLRAAGLENLTGTEQRLEQGYYDRVYILWPQASLTGMLATSYTQIATLPGTGPTGLKRGLFGITHRGVHIWERQVSGETATRCRSQPLAEPAGAPASPEPGQR